MNAIFSGSFETYSVNHKDFQRGTPSSVILKIFCHLAEENALQSVGFLRSTCKRFNKIGEHQTIWKIFCLQVPELGDYRSCEDYRDVYKKYKTAEKSIRYGSCFFDPNPICLFEKYSDGIICIKDGHGKLQICDMLKNTSYFISPDILEGGKNFHQFILKEKKQGERVTGIDIFDLRIGVSRTFHAKSNLIVGEHNVGNTALCIHDMMFLDKKFLVTLVFKKELGSIDASIWDMEKSILFRTIENVIQTSTKQTVDLFAQGVLCLMHQEATNRRRVSIWDVKNNTPYAYTIDNAILKQYGSEQLIPYVGAEYIAYYSSDEVMTFVNRTSFRKCFVDLGALDKNIRAICCLRQRSFAPRIDYLVVNEDAGLLVCVHKDQQARRQMEVWDLNRPGSHCQHPLKAGEHAIDISAVGSCVSVYDESTGKQTLFDMKSLKEILVCDHSSGLSPSGHCLFLSAPTRDHWELTPACIYNTRSGQQVSLNLDGIADDGYYHYDFDSNAALWGQFLAVTAELKKTDQRSGQAASEGGYIVIFDTNTGHRLVELPVGKAQNLGTLSWLNDCLTLSVLDGFERYQIVKFN